MSSANSDSFASSFPIWITFLFLLWLLWLGLPKLCSVKVARVGIINLLLILGWVLSVFQCWVWCFLWVCHCCYLVTKSCPTLLTPWTVAARLFCLWDPPGKNTWVGSHPHLQGIFPTQRSNQHLLHWQAVSFPLSHEGSPWVCHIQPLLCWGMFPLCPLSGDFFIINGCWILSNFFYIYWDNWMFFILQFVNMVYHTDWLAEIKKSSYP